MNSELKLEIRNHLNDVVFAIDHGDATVRDNAESITSAIEILDEAAKYLRELKTVNTVSDGDLLEFETEVETETAAKALSAADECGLAVAQFQKRFNQAVDGGLQAEMATFCYMAFREVHSGDVKVAEVSVDVRPNHRTKPNAS